MKKVMSLILALTMVLTMTACGSKDKGTAQTPAETPAEKPAEGRTYELTMASYVATGTVIGLVGEKVVELADKYSDGRIKINYHQDGTLGSELENIQQMKTGEIDIGHFGDNFGSQIATGIDPTVIPFIFKDVDDVKAVYDDPVLGAAIKDAAKENANCYLIGVQERTPRLLTASKEIKTPADLNGVKVRVPEIPDWVTVWNSLGALCTVVAWPETYSALQTGVVDAQENPIDNIFTNKIFEVNKYIMNTEHLYGLHHWCINADTFDSMDPADQEILQRAFDEANAWGDAELEKLAQGYWDQVLADGSVTVVDVDKDAWSAAAQEGINAAMAGYSKEAQDYIANYLG